MANYVYRDRHMVSLWVYQTASPAAAAAAVASLGRAHCGSRLTFSTPVGMPPAVKQYSYKVGTSAVHTAVSAQGNVVIVLRSSGGASKTQATLSHAIIAVVTTYRRVALH